MCSVQKAKLGAKQWTNAQQSLLNLEERNIAFVDEIVRSVHSPTVQVFSFIVVIFFLDCDRLYVLCRGGMDANQALRVRFSSGVSSTVEDTDAASKHLLSSIDRKLSRFRRYKINFCLSINLINMCRFFTTRP